MLIPPGPLSPRSAAELSRLLAEFQQFKEMRAAAPLTLDRVGGIPVLGASLPPRILARITGGLMMGDNDSDSNVGCAATSDGYCAGCHYSFQEVYLQKGSCIYVDVIGGIQGRYDNYPAIEINGSTTVATGTVVELFLAPSGDHWRFQQGGGGSGEGGWFDARVQIVHVDCEFEVEISRRYKGYEVIPDPTLAGNWIPKPNGKLWDGVDDRIYEVNNHMIGPDTVCRVRFANTVTTDKGSGVNETFRQWHVYYNERDPDCMMRVMHMIDGADCTVCEGWYGISSDLYSATPIGAYCEIGTGCSSDTPPIS